MQLRGCANVAAGLSATGQSGKTGSRRALILHTQPPESLTGICSGCRKAWKETWPHIKGETRTAWG